MCERKPAPGLKTEPQYGHLRESAGVRHDNDLFPVRFISIAFCDITHDIKDIGVREG
jgi:hypothetical protein